MTQNATSAHFHLGELLVWDLLCQGWTGRGRHQCKGAPIGGETQLSPFFTHDFSKALPCILQNTGRAPSVLLPKGSVCFPLQIWREHNVLEGCSTQHRWG